MNAKAVAASFAPLQKKWQGQSPKSAALMQAKPVEKSTVYFYDIPGAKQSVLNLSRPSLNATHAGFAKYPGNEFYVGGYLYLQTQY